MTSMCDIERLYAHVGRKRGERGGGGREGGREEEETERERLCNFVVIRPNRWLDIFFICTSHFDGQEEKKNEKRKKEKRP